MNDMLGTPIVAEDIVLYDGQVCKVVSSTTSQIKYVCGNPWSNEDTLREHGTTMNTKVLKLTGFEPDRIDLKAAELSTAATDYMRPGKPELSVEEQTAKKVERDRRNKLKKDTKPFDIIRTGHYDNLIYFGKFTTTPTNEDSEGTYHVYAYVGYVSRSSNIVSEIMTTNHNRSYTLYYQKSMKQPTSIIHDRNEELKAYFKTVVPSANGRVSYISENYTRIRELLKDI